MPHELLVTMHLENMKRKRHGHNLSDAVMDVFNQLKCKFWRDNTYFMETIKPRQNGYFNEV